MDGSATGTAFRVLRNLGFRDLYRFSEMKQFVVILDARIVTAIEFNVVYDYRDVP